MTVTMDFDHDVQTVYAALTDAQFIVDRSLALGELSAECEVEELDNGATVNFIREVERELPRALARLFNPVQTMDMTEQWRPEGEGWRGEWSMDVRGQPVTISASFDLVPTAGGCRYSVSHRAKAKIPLVGKQVEKYILGQTAEGARDELGYLKDYLG